MLFLIRHGETDWNKNHIIQGKSDVPLNETGREQARARAEAFRGADISAVVSSPLKRASETAKIIAQVSGAKTFYTDNRFRERYFGIHDGKYSQRRPFKFYFGPIESGEDHEALYTRLMSGLRDVTRRFDGHTIVVAHGAILGSYVNHQIKRDDFRLVNTACIAVIPETLEMVDFNISNETIRKFLSEI